MEHLMVRHHRVRNLIATGVALTCAGFGASASAQPYPGEAPPLLEAYPDDVQASIERREHDLGLAAADVTAVGARFIIPLALRWNPGSTIRVAFQGGDPALYAKIEDAASDWTKPGIANIRFQFKDASGKYLQWTTNDTTYAAEIRVSFSEAGQWSYIGTLSVDPKVRKPNQNSLNLENYDKKLPYLWRSTITHEFGHALGFQHEHQSPTGGCDFRLDDDAGYKPTQYPDGVYRPDPDGRRPGLYTLLGGPPNKWPKEKVDAQLKALPSTYAFMVSPFDRDSIMKYYFEASFFQKGEQSACYTKAPSEQLSASDMQGAHLIYPSDPVSVAVALRERQQVLEQLAASRYATPDVRAFVGAQIRSIGRVLQTTRESPVCSGRTAGGC
jgi:hypothetical protein